MRIGKLFGLIAAFLVCVSLIRAINIEDPAKDDVRLYDVLLTVQGFEYDSTTVLDLYNGFEVLKDYPILLDPVYQEGNVDLNFFYVLFRYLIDCYKWTINLFTGVLWPLIRLLYDSLVLCGDVLSLAFKLLGFAQ